MLDGCHGTWTRRGRRTPRRNPPWPSPLRLHRLGTRHHGPGQPPAQLRPLRAAILRIAASLGDHHIPAHLARVLGSLDHANIALVTTAIARANG